MAVYFGIDSAARLDTGGLATITSELHLPSYPSWVGRYLGSGGGAADPLTSEESSMLLAATVRQVLIYNNAGPQDVSSTFEVGVQHGQAAVAAARALGAPVGVLIALDIEQSWWPSGAFLTGWVSAVAGAGYIPMIYGNAISVPNGAAMVAAYREARSQVAVLYWWSPTPQAYAGQILDAPNSPFLPNTIPGYEGDAAMWQYDILTYPQLCDLDVCTELAYAHMWGQAPTITETIARGALKSQPNHTSAPAIDAAHHGVILGAGRVVVPSADPHTGLRAATDVHGVVWRHIELPQTPVHGWFPALNLRSN